MSQGDRELTRRFWRETPFRALAPLLAAVFFTFSAIGFLVDVAGLGRMQPRVLAGVVAISGLVAVAYALIGMRRRYWLFAPVIVLQVLLPRWLEQRWPPGPILEGDALRTRLALDAAGAVTGLALGYGLFMIFIVRQGLRRSAPRRRWRSPARSTSRWCRTFHSTTETCEIYGRSIPASEVGGDLVDALVASRPPARLRGRRLGPRRAGRLGDGPAEGRHCARGSGTPATRARCSRR